MVNDGFYMVNDVFLIWLMIDVYMVNDGFYMVNDDVFCFIYIYG